MTIDGARHTFALYLEELETDQALDEVRATLELISWRVFGENQDGRATEIVDAAVEAFDAKREQLRRAEETYQLLGRFWLINEDVGVHSQHTDTEARRLLDMWDETDRRYHTRAHLVACLEELDKYKNRGARDWRCIALAIWCHDCVYETTATPGVNEQESAAVCRQIAERLGWPHDRVAAAVRMVLNTARHGYAVGSFDEALMVDIDLAILSASPDEYDRFEEQIREEYAHVPEKEFRAARAKVLRELGGETFSYRSGPFLERNDAARANLKRAIERLEG